LQPAGKYRRNVVSGRARDNSIHQIDKRRVTRNPAAGVAICEFLDFSVPAAFLFFQRLELCSQAFGLLDHCRELIASKRLLLALVKFPHLDVRNGLLEIGHLAS